MRVSHFCWNAFEHYYIAGYLYTYHTLWAFAGFACFLRQEKAASWRDEAKGAAEKPIAGDLSGAGWWCDLDWNRLICCKFVYSRLGHVVIMSVVSSTDARNIRFINLTFLQRRRVHRARLKELWKKEHLGKMGRTRMLWVAKPTLVSVFRSCSARKVDHFLLQPGCKMPFTKGPFESCIKLQEAIILAVAKDELLQGFDKNKEFRDAMKDSSTECFCCLQKSALQLATRIITSTGKSWKCSSESSTKMAKARNCCRDQLPKASQENEGRVRELPREKFGIVHPPVIKSHRLLNRRLLACQAC